MSDIIGGYRLLTAMQTTGSGSARWCMAMRGMECFFLKEFLSPVWPSKSDTLIGHKQMERCLCFEKRKLRLYAAASCVLGDVLVPVVDFFREKGHYYAVTEAVPDGHMTAERFYLLPDDEKKNLLYALAVGLQRLHAQGIVHADLKPEHVMLIPQDHGWQPKLIDIDSGFLTDDPPRTEQELEGDPAYLAPETYLRMVGEKVQPGPSADIFAFGAMIHQLWTGLLPDFDREHYHYLYEAVLDDGEIRLDLPESWQVTVKQMLHADPACRPKAVQVAALFAPECKISCASGTWNGLKGLMKV